MFLFKTNTQIFFGSKSGLLETWPFINQLFQTKIGVKNYFSSQRDVTSLGGMSCLIFLAIVHQSNPAKQETFNKWFFQITVDNFFFFSMICTMSLYTLNVLFIH